MKKLLLSYAAYNLWANKKLAEVITRLDESLSFTPITSSFPNIFLTVEHIWQAELAWLLRIQQVPPTTKPEFPDKDIQALLNTWVLQSKAWEAFIEQATEEQFEEMVAYKSWQGIPFTTPLWQIAQHVFNHSTFHRGQLITMLRTLGVTSFPQTDYIAFAREVG